MFRRVHQIVFSDRGKVRPQGYIREAMTSVRRTFPDYDYTVWTLEEAGSFIEEHFSPDVLQAFMTLRPYAYKADLFKYCVLRREGGWVVDAGVTMLRHPVNLQEGATPPEFVLFRATGLWDPPWNCSVALIYAAAGHPVFDSAIEGVVHHCRTRYYGHSPVMPTMSPFGLALAQHRVFENTRLGTVVDVHEPEYRRGYQLKPEGIVAERKPPSAKPGDVQSIGLPGTNNYVALWEQRAVYGEQAEPTS